MQLSQAASGAQSGGGMSTAVTRTNVPNGALSFGLHVLDVDPVEKKTAVDQVHRFVWMVPAIATGVVDGVLRDRSPSDALWAERPAPVWRKAQRVRRGDCGSKLRVGVLGLQPGT